MPETIVNTPLIRRERLKLAVTVVQNTDRTGEAEFPCATPTTIASSGLLTPAPSTEFDGDAELGVAGEPFELPVEHAKTFLRNVVRRDVVYADLQIIESGHGSSRESGQRSAAGRW